jgi:hypothetical protein
LNANIERRVPVKIISPVGFSPSPRSPEGMMSDMVAVADVVLASAV